MLTHFFILTMLAAIAADSSSTSADARGGRSVPHVLVDTPQVLDLDKSGTTGGQEKKNGSQAPNTKGLASHVSFVAERTGFSESLPAAVRRLSQTVDLKQLRSSANDFTYYADTLKRQCPALQKRYKLLSLLSS